MFNKDKILIKKKNICCIRDKEILIKKNFSNTCCLLKLFDLNYNKQEMPAWINSMLKVVKAKKSFYTNLKGKNILLIINSRIFLKLCYKY